MSVVASCAVIGVAAVVGAGCEWLAQRLVYRNPKSGWREAKKKLENLQRQLDDNTAALARVGLGPKIVRQLEGVKQAIETQMTGLSQLTTGLQMRATFLMGAINLVVFWVLSTVFDQTVMLRLPFEPLSFITGMTHRGVPGEDMREAGFVFVYVLAGVFIRPITTMVFGAETTPPGSAFGQLFKTMDDTDKRK